MNASAMLSTTPGNPSARLLGNAPAVLLFAAAGFAVTAGILAVQAHFRAGLFDPQAVPVFARLFLFEDYPASLLMLGLIVLVTVLAPARRLAAALAAAIGRHPGVTALATFAVLCFGAVFIHHAHPLAMDESAPYMQARIFAAGHIKGQVPPHLVDWLVHESVRGIFIHASTETGQVISAYWPGFALLLTPFMALGVPWACNPALGAASVWVVHRLTLRLTESTEAAGTAALLMLASAAFVINSISFYSMTAHLLCNAAFALLLLKPTATRALCAGLIGGIALTLHNPVPHLLFALPWLLWLLWCRRWQALLLIAAGYLPWVLVVGFGWRHVIEGVVARHGGPAGSQSGGLGDALAMLRSVLAVPGPQQLLERAIAAGKVWLWAAPLLLLLAGAGFWRHRRTGVVRLLLISAVLTFVGFLFVPVSQGHGWGFRYFHSAWFVLPVLAALALVPAMASEDDHHGSAGKGQVAWTQAGALGALLVMVPYFAWQVHGFIGAHLRQLPEPRSGEPKLVVVSPNGYYSLDLVQNDPFLRDPVIRMASRGWDMDRQMVAARFPELVLLRREPRGSVWGRLPASEQSQ